MSTPPRAAPSERFYRRLASHADLRFVVLDPVRIGEPDFTQVNALAARMLSPQVCREFTMIPIGYQEGIVTVATSDPFDDLAHDTAERLTGARIEFAVAPREEIGEAIERVLAPAPPDVPGDPVEGEPAGAEELVPSAEPSATPRLGELLVARGMISTTQLADALEEGERVGARLGQVLTHGGVVREDDVLRVLSEHFGLPLIDLTRHEPDREALALIPEAVQRQLRCVPLSTDGRTLHVAVADELDEETVTRLREHTVLRLRGYLASPRALDDLLQRAHADEYVHEATSAMRERFPEECANRVLTNVQKAVAALLLVVIAVALVFATTTTLIVLTAASSVFYVASSLYRFKLTYSSLGHRNELEISDEDLAALDPRDLPVYTILVPLYREAAVVPELVASIEAIDYPKPKLDVKLLCEADDEETPAAIRALDLPPHYELVVVPDALPKTKPKACNYGLLLADGEFTVIFDAEDRPEPDQLKKAVLAFWNTPDEVVCIQAELNFYNSDQNLLTRWFTTEYSMWFDLVLPGLHAERAPIPLGGTSCHFVTETLIDLGAWDPYNVTEDADLGMRLHRHGYRASMIDSLTLEEANPEVRNWIRQRSRWIKGYLQTYFVHMRSPFATARGMGLWSWISFQLVIGAAFILILNPIFWFLTTLFFFTQAGFIADIFPGFVFYAAAFQLFVGNFIFVYLNVAGSIQRGYPELAKYALFSPIYWGLMSLAALKGTFQLVTNPFYWEKTEHGLSTTTGMTATAPLRAGEQPHGPPLAFAAEDESVIEHDDDEAFAENGDVDVSASGEPAADGADEEHAEALSSREPAR